MTSAAHSSATNGGRKAQSAAPLRIAASGPSVGTAPAMPAPDQPWIDIALRAVRTLAASGRPFQAHDLVLECDVPEPRDHHQWGALMSIARAEGYVTAVAAVPSTRPKTARSLCRLWVGSVAWRSEQNAAA